MRLVVRSDVGRQEVAEVVTRVAEVRDCVPDTSVYIDVCMKGPLVYPLEPAYPCCLPALGRFTG